MIHRRMGQETVSNPRRPNAGCRVLLSVFILGWPAGLAAFQADPGREVPTDRPVVQTDTVAEKKSGLGDRLIRQSTSGSDEDVLDAILRLMGESAYRLNVDLDPGEETQQVQLEILKKLDESIQSAASQTRSVSKPRPREQSDKRTASKNKSRGDQKSESSGSASPSQNPTQDSAPPGTSAASSATGGSLEESRRSWGNLPDRERDEIIQGLGEEHSQRLSPWIQRYYRTLQESEDE